MCSWWGVLHVIGLRGRPVMHLEIPSQVYSHASDDGPEGPSLGKTIRCSPISESTHLAGITDYLIIPVSFPSLIEGC